MPESRLQVILEECRSVFGDDVLERRLELVVAALQSASSDFCAILLADALKGIADALADDPLPIDRRVAISCAGRTRIGHKRILRPRPWPCRPATGQCGWSLKQVILMDARFLARVREGHPQLENGHHHDGDRDHDGEPLELRRHRSA
jgi:hypothetical protein